MGKISLAFALNERIFEFIGGALGAARTGEKIMTKSNEVVRTEAMKVEAKAVADQLRKAGFEVFSSGYGAITMRVKSDDAGFTVVPTAEARKLLAA